VQHDGRQTWAIRQPEATLRFVAVVSAVSVEIDLPDRVDSAATLSRRSVLSLYWLIPSCLAVVGVDTAIGSPLKRFLPTSPEHWLLFTLFFGTPHIVASSLMLFGIAEYRHHYARRLLLWSAAIISTLAVLDFVVSYDVIYALIAGWTVKHVLGQQFGIGNSVARCRGRIFEAWEVCGFAAGTLAFLVLYRGAHWPHRWVTLGRQGVVVLCLLVFGGGLVLLCRTQTRVGRIWIGSNTALVLVSALMLLIGYPFFTVLIPRIIHDTTAFKVYAVHESNRARHLGKNSWRKVAMGGGAACGIAYLLEQALDRPLVSLTSWVGLHVMHPASLYVAGFLGLLHYCSEASTWRSGSPYRRHFALTD
jgi:hypothetical protein